MKREKIIDSSGDRKYFTLVPNYVINHSTFAEQALYLTMKRLAGEKGTCWASRSCLAKRLGISENFLVKTRSSLIKRGWIKKIGKKENGPKGQATNEYEIVDLWKFNVEHYEAKKGGSPQDPLSKGGSPGDGKVGHEVTKGGSPGDDKEETVKKKHVKKKHTGDTSAKPPVDNSSLKTKEFLEYFGSEWSKWIGGGEIYPCNYGKDGSIIKGLLKTYGFEKLSALAARFFSLDDDWVRERGYTIGLFKSQIPKLLAGRKKTSYEAAMDFADELKQKREEFNART